MCQHRCPKSRKVKSNPLASHLGLSMICTWRAISTSWAMCHFALGLRWKQKIRRRAVGRQAQLVFLTTEGKWGDHLDKRLSITLQSLRSVLLSSPSLFLKASSEPLFLIFCPAHASPRPPRLDEPCGGGHPRCCSKIYGCAGGAVERRACSQRWRRTRDQCIQTRGGAG
jgi:hypothetical protein